MDFGFEEEKEPGTRDGRILATIEIRAVGGSAGNARLTVTGPARWVRFPPSCEVKGAGLSCGLGDLAGTTVLRLGFREKGAEGERLRAVVESANAPRVVRTVRLPGPGERSGSAGEGSGRTGEGSGSAGEGAAEPLKAAPVRPSKVRTAGPKPVRPRALGPEPAPSVSRPLSPATERKSSPAAKTKRKPSRDTDVLRAPSAPVSTPSRSTRSSRTSPAAPVVPANPASPASPAVPAAPAVPGVPAVPAAPANPANPANPAVPAAPFVPGVPADPDVPGVLRTPSAVEPPSALPVLPKGPVVALPPVRPAETAMPLSRSSVTSAEGPLADDGREWLVVLAVALAGEAALLWFVTTLALWRRRT